MARTRFTKLSTRLGRSLRREEWGRRRELTKLVHAAPRARPWAARTPECWKIVPKARQTMYIHHRPGRTGCPGKLLGFSFTHSLIHPSIHPSIHPFVQQTLLELCTGLGPGWDAPVCRSHSLLLICPSSGLLPAGKRTYSSVQAPSTVPGHRTCSINVCGREGRRNTG